MSKTPASTSKTSQMTSQSRRADRHGLLLQNAEGRQGIQDARLKNLEGASERARQTLFKPDGTLRFLHYCVASGKRGAVLQISCKVRGLPLLRTALVVDGKDFSAVYERAVRVIAEAFDLGSDEELVGDMLATSQAFLRQSGLHLVEVTYKQVVPQTKA